MRETARSAFHEIKCKEMEKATGAMDSDSLRFNTLQQSQQQWDVHPSANH